MVPVVCVVGKSKVGKTTLAEKLIIELKSRGYRVATIKHSHHDFEIDQEGKDSWRHARAGSDASIISTPGKMALIEKVDHDSKLAELSRLIGLDFDIILAEGFKQDKAPKIEVHRKDVSKQLLCHEEELLAIATDEPLEISAPQYSLDDAPGIVDLIEKRFLRQEGDEIVSLRVNGEPVPLSAFPRSIISKTLFGMITSLKKVPPAERIDISIRRKKAE